MRFSPPQVLILSSGFIRGEKFRTLNYLAFSVSPLVQGAGSVLELEVDECSCGGHRKAGDMHILQQLRNPFLHRNRLAFFYHTQHRRIERLAAGSVILSKSSQEQVWFRRVPPKLRPIVRPGFHHSLVNRKGLGDCIRAQHSSRRHLQFVPTSREERARLVCDGQRRSNVSGLDSRICVHCDCWM